MVKWRHLGFFGLALGSILLSGNAVATTKFDITINPVLSLEMSTEMVSFEADGNLHSGYVNLNVTSNNQTGFTATMTTTGESNSLEHITLDSAEIPTLTSTTTDDNFPTNHWGYSLDDGESYNAVPALGSPVTVFTTEKANDFGQRNIHFGVKVDQTMPSGVYQNTIVVTAMANYVPDDIRTLADIAYMQDVNSDICYNTATPLASDVASTPQYQLTDKRDNKTYWVAKLADGNCWMTQNLDLGSSNETILDSTNTNLADGSIFTLSNFRDPGDQYFVTSGTTSDDVRYDSLSACIAAGNTQEICEHGHSGNYYNWYAATAYSGTSDMKRGEEASWSICPKGWRLPYGANINGSWGYLLNSYTPDFTTSQALRTTPFYFARTGRFYYLSDSQPEWVGFHGGYWSSMAIGEITTCFEVQSLNIRGSFASAFDANCDYQSFSIRCVAE